jgi:aspartate kinase
LEFYYYESIQIWGASVKDAEGIKNVYDVLQKVGYEDVLLVVSAMGKPRTLLKSS